MLGFCFIIALHVRQQQMGSGGLFVLLSMTTNQQKHTDESDVIVQEMSANRVKIRSAFTAHLETAFYAFSLSNFTKLFPKLDTSNW